jgi:hypothetical protein
MSLRFKQLYKELLLPVTCITGWIGFISGLNTNINIMDKYNINNIPKKLGFKYFTNIVGHSTLGIITGVTFPVSLPVLTMYTVFSKDK